MTMEQLRPAMTGITVLLPYPGQEAFGAALAQRLGARTGRIACRRFPDGESLVTVDDAVRGEHVAILASLRGADAMALPLRFAGDTLRENGAASVGLVAPYLAYMRQDSRFEPGQAVSAPLFARFVEDAFDWVVTVDPHLHRIPSLNRIYRKPALCASAAPQVARWIRDNVRDPFLIGPDSESRQWVARIAELAGAPFDVLEKIRRGDTDVEVSLPDAARARGRHVVVIDDILSSGQTVVQTLRRLGTLDLLPATCIGIHAVLSGDAVRDIAAAGASRIVTCDTIAHATNGISVVDAVAETCLSLPAARAPSPTDGTASPPTARRRSAG